MKAIHALMSVLAISVAGSAIAADGDYPESEIAKVESTKSRAEVMAEAREANRLGLLTVGEEDVRVAGFEPTKSRAEVIAETFEAQRLGLLTVGEEDIRVATAEQEALIVAAGRRAAERVLIAARPEADATE